MSMMHPRDLRAIMAAILGSALPPPQYHHTRAKIGLAQADEILEELDRTARPEPTFAESITHTDIGPTLAKINKAGFIGIDTMIQCLDARMNTIHQLNGEVSRLKMELAQANAGLISGPTWGQALKDARAAAEEAALRWAHRNRPESRFDYAEPPNNYIARFRSRPGAHNE